MTSSSSVDAARIALDGVWDFLHVVEDYRSRPVKWRRISVPAPWQAQFSDLRMHGGTGLYKRAFEVPAGWVERGRVLLCFGAVFHITRVWINGSLVGNHVGGFLPFRFDVTDRIHEGVNEIKVRVDSPSDDPSAFPDTPFAELPFGKQSWYGPLSGIWQSVYLEQRSPDYLRSLRIRADPDLRRIDVTAFLDRPVGGDLSLVAQIFDPSGREVHAATLRLEQGQSDTRLWLDLPAIDLWSPEQPRLYRLRVNLVRTWQAIDAMEDRFGFRKIEARDSRFYLNGELLYLRAALDQDYYPDTICTTPSVAFLEDQFAKAKQLGLNCIRCHIKVPDPRYYEVADRMGMLIWTELPNMGAATQRSRVRTEETLKGIIDRDGNHPSIVCWTIINENWGLDLVHDAEHRAWLRQTFAWLKSYDPGRLVVDNSPLAPSFHVETDIADYHFYAAFPDSRADWDSFIDQLASRPDWLFSPEDGVSTGKEPLVCSEFGNWGLPDPDLLADAEGHEPWWFETGHDWAEGVMYPHGVQNRFADWSLSRVFDGLKGFVEAAQWQQFRALKYEVESMRARPEIAGYVITELTDAHWESNGLLDFRRNPRVFHDVFASINADTVIVPLWKRVAYWAGEMVEIEVIVAHGAGAPLTDTILSAGFEQEQMQTVAPQAAGTAVSLGTLAFVVPAVERSCVRRLHFELRGSDGTPLARNAVDLAVHPRREPPDRALAIWAPEVEIRNFLAGLGYTVLRAPAADALWVCTDPAAGTEHVRNGGRLLVLPVAECSLTPYFPHWQNVHLRERDRTLWRGDWASTFAWLRRGHAFAGLPGGPLLDEAFDRVLPKLIISGCNLLDFQARVHGALAIGWIHKPVAITVERRYGKGRLVVSTFRLFRDPPGADPTAAVLLDSLLALALAEGSAAARERDEILGDLI
jgi:hypothetical protein